MRECWINVYVWPNEVGCVLGTECVSRKQANHAAIGPSMCECSAPALAKRLYQAGVGYRLHVRLKVPALPDSDALAAGKAGEEGRASA